METGSAEAQQETTSHHVQLDQFEGPLDLLIFLIRKNEVSIYDIPVARITEQYLEILSLAKSVDLDMLTDFYLMAATLLHIKSRMLLPEPEIEDGEDWDDPRRELVDRLIEYQRYRRLTDLMASREDEVEYTLERRSAQTILPFSDDDEVWEQLDVWQLLGAFSRIIKNVSSDALIDLYEEVTVNEKITLIHELLDEHEEFSFNKLLGPGNSILHLVCAFIAILEAARQRSVSIQQNRMFGDIRIVRSKSVEPRT